MLHDVGSSPAIFSVNPPVPICALPPGAGHCIDGAVYLSTIEMPIAGPKSSHISNPATGTVRAQTVCTGMPASNHDFERR
jgi:hypothetical protein